LILERADGFPEWGNVGKEGPGPLKNGRLFLAVLALMVRCIARGRLRDKGLVAAGASWLMERVNALPTCGTKEGHGIGTQYNTAGDAFHRQYKPKSLTAPSGKPILSALT